MGCPIAFASLEFVNAYIDTIITIMMKIQSENLDECIGFGNLYCKWNFMM